MSQFTFEIPENHDYEIIVVGGGPAGCCAATAAAREGKKVLLIEATDTLGGMATSGLVQFWCGYANGGEPVVNGLCRKVVEASKEAVKPEIRALRKEWKPPINAEAMKMIYDRMVTEAGVHVLFRTTLSKALTDGEGRVTSLIVTNKAGLTSYVAKAYIDCTGDGDLVAFAGGEFQKGDAYGEMQNGTLCFALDHVHVEHYKEHPIKEHRSIYPNEKYPLISDGHCVPVPLSDSVMAFNAGSLYGVDGTDPESISETLFKGRELAHEIHEALKEKIPDMYGDSEMIRTASLLGIRETRRIVGDYQLTAADYFAREVFPDEIARNCYHLDSHETKREREMIKAGIHREEKNSETVFEAGESHGIPYRSLCPKSLRNVIVAGRCFSSDRRVNGATRIMCACMSMGEAAGIAAAMAMDQKEANFHEIDTDLLRKKLIFYGGNIQ